MDFLKVKKKFRKPHKPVPEKDLEDKPVRAPEELKNDTNIDGDLKKSTAAEAPADTEEDDDDDFITNEVKRRLKELRRNSFMMLIPEEEELCLDDEEVEEAGETSSNEWRDLEAEGRQWWVGFDTVYDKYCERMLFFDRIRAQQIKETGSQQPSTPSPKSASKKLTSPFRCLSLKKIEEPDEEAEQLQDSIYDPYQDLETAYVAHVCLTWEALHCQYTQLSQIILCHPESPICYNHSAQQFQQFQVLLQRYIENEPFEEGQRPEIYARARHILPKLLQAPNMQGSEQEEDEESDSLVLAHDFIRVIENAILTFYIFLKMDKKRSGVVLNLFGNQNAMATPLQQVQSSLEKKRIKLKDLTKKRKGWKRNSWPQTREDVQLLLSLIDMKVISRVLRMLRISKEQLFWCEEKMKKLELSDGKLQRDPTPLLFPLLV